jgi:hypothetical protein
MTGKLGYRVLVIVVLGTCALAQDRGQPRAVASISDMPADNVPGTTSLRRGFESRDTSPVAAKQPSPYSWKTTPLGESAQLLTLFCRTCNVLGGIAQDVPLVSVVRDTLGDQTSENDCVTYVWLLTYARPRVRQRILSAIPFFYWRAGKDAIHLPKLPFGAIRPFRTFLQPMGFRRHFWLTSSTVGYRLSRHFRPLRQFLVLNGLESSLIWQDLASRRIWYAICVGRRVQSRD